MKWLLASGNILLFWMEDINLPFNKEKVTSNSLWLYFNITNQSCSKLPKSHISNKVFVLLMIADS
jgi:hypothetical protein